MREFIERLVWGLVSLVAAFGLWYGLVRETEVAVDVPVAVQFRNLPPDLELTSDPPERIFMKLRGPASRLSAAELRATSLVLDLRDVHAPGEQTLVIGPRELDLPAGVSLVRVVPASVRLTMDRRAEREVPVEVRYDGPPPAGYRLASQRVTPATVRLVGPASRLDRVSAASTDAINLASTIGKAEFRVPVWIEDGHIRVVSGESHVVTVQVQLERIPGS